MIGVLGGTFDPVHFGHLRPALEVMQALGLEQVRFVPNRIPPHRETPWLDVDKRLELLKTAIEDQPGFFLDQREINRDGHSYMVDTLESLHTEFPSHGLCLILGMDAFLGLKQWHQWQRIPELCHLVVTTRPGSKIDPDFIDSLPATLATSVSALTKQAAGRILLQSVTQLDISASRIRMMLAGGQSVRYLLPDEVNRKLMKMVIS
ncbi:MAG: nicotinate-nucleotide adenylyltransferase [Gammaproteobacteria bacterium]|nr:nicotinate-nucleotide adenylyltransferase [Gammaproteobacteria bacterium]